MIVSKVTWCFLVAWLGLSLAFQVPRTAVLPHSLSSLTSQPATKYATHVVSTRYDTSLQMGLRSFIKKKILGLGDGDDDQETQEDNDEDEEPSEYDPEAPPAGQTVAEAAEAELREEERKDMVSPYRTESVQERINRVKSGKMTDEEKQAFLRTALSAKDTSVSRKPLRQALPSEKDLSSTKRPMGKASPFPKDSFMRFARGPSREEADTTKDIISTARNLKDGPSIEAQKKKREYLEMVTDPNRFHTYKSGSGPPSIPTSVETTIPETDVDEIDDDDTDLTVVQEKIVEENTTITTKAPPDLGSRLGAAAMAKEQQRLQVEEEKEQLRKKLEEEKQEEQRLLEEQCREDSRMREAEIQRQQLEIKVRRLEQEEAQAREEMRRQLEEEDRQRQLLDAQEAYWKRKLSAERAARVRGASTEDKSRLEDYRPPKEEVPTARTEQSQVTEPDINPLEMPEMEKPIAPPQQTTGGISPRTAADILGKNPKKKPLTPSSMAFQEEQARQKAELDRKRDEQIARLKSLNSPLPSASTGVTPAVTPLRSPPPRPMSSPRPPTQSPARPAVPVKRDLGPPMPSIREMTRLKTTAPKPAVNNPVDEKSDGGNGLAGFSRRMFGGYAPKASEPVKAPIKPEEPKKQVIRQPLPLGDNAKAKGPVKAEESKRSVIRQSLPLGDGTQGRAPVKAEEPKRRVIRQQLPLDDNPKKRVIRQPLPLEDEEEEEDYGRNGPNKDMSIADAMKKAGTIGESDDQSERSKKWGINMSRISKPNDKK